MFRRALLQKNGNAIARAADAPAEFLQFGFQNFVISAFDHLGDTRLKRSQPASDRVRNKINIADAKLAAFAKI